MTDKELAEEYEEKAEEYLDKKYLKNMGIRRPVKEAYLDGLIEGKPKWHDLRKDPNDLPNGYRAVLNQDGMNIVYDYDNKVWRNDDADEYICDDPIAWCEIPIFKE